MVRKLGAGRVAIAVATVTLGVLTTACGSDEATSASPETVPAAAGAAASEVVTPLTPAEGAALLAERGTAITVIDVRTAEEFAGARLDGAVNINVEAADFDDKVGELDRSGAYAVYCRSGRRSALAAARLVELGFTDVHDLGGIEDWIAAGNPIVEG